MNDFKTVFKEATGVSLTAVKSTGLNFSPNCKFISIGYNGLTESAGIQKDSALGQDGFTIKVKDNTVFILGEDDGALYGVYELLNQLFGYEYYAKEVYSLVPKNDISLDDVKNETVIPDIANRAGGYGTMWQEGQPLLHVREYGVKVYTDYFARVNNEVFHNTFLLLPYNAFGTTHSKWYSNDHTQLCFTAHGDATEYQLMVSTLAESLYNSIKLDPNKEYISLCIEDGASVCNCSACVNSKNTYGANSGAYVKFANDVNAVVRNKLQEDGIFTDIKIAIFAYLGYYEAPTKGNLKTDDGVMVIVCPIETTYNDAFRQVAKDNFTAWKTVSSDIGFWLYDSAFGSEDGINYSFVPFYSLNGLKERYQFINSLGAEYIFNQGLTFGYRTLSGFNNLKMYINSKLGWNVNANVNTLTDNFFNNVYGPASENMKLLYNKENAILNAIKEDKGYGGTPYNNHSCRAEYWSLSDLNLCREYISRALSDIENLKTTNETLYNRIYKYIVAERIDIDYLMIKHYGSIPNIDDIKDELKDDIIVTGIQVSLSGNALYNSLVG